MANITAASNFTIEDCTLSTCPIDLSNYAYVPSLAANATLCALFGAMMIIHLAQGVWWKTWGFVIAFTLGNITEVLGYAGRIWSHFDPFAGNPFMMQIVCLTIAPAFFSAGIYLCLSRIVTIFGASISRIPPKAYTYIFITCDIFSLVLQAIGGAMASIESSNQEDPALGTHVMVAGLAFQVFTLTLFIILSAEYFYRVRTTTKSLNSATERLRNSIRFKGFLLCLALSTLFIYIRSIYRVIELAEGWRGNLISVERYFIVLEGVMVVFAVAVMNGFHPGFGFQGSYDLRAEEAEKDGRTGGSEAPSEAAFN